VPAQALDLLLGALEVLVQLPAGVPEPRQGVLARRELRAGRVERGAQLLDLALELTGALAQRDELALARERGLGVERVRVAQLGAEPLVLLAQLRQRVGRRRDAVDVRVHRR